MKKLLVLLTLLSSINNLKAQAELFVQEGKTWTENTGDFFEDTFFTLTYRFNGSDIIDNIEYARLEVAVGLSDTYNLAGNYREENGVVFQKTSDSEIVIYDFNLDVGETFDAEFGETFTVTEASVVQYAGAMRKKIVFGDAPVFDCGGTDTGMGEVWIEGVGSLTGFNERFFNLDLVSCISCYTEDGVNFFYPFTETFSTENCRIASLSIDDFTKFKSTFIPNPITEQSIVTINDFQNNTTIAFYSILGQRISQKELTNNTTVINRSEFPATGIYFYQIQQEGQVVETQKFIVK